MDKISGIVKSSPRIQSVDLRDSSPVRPGTPSFGRLEGVSSLAKPEFKSEMEASMSTAKRATGVADELVGWKMKDQKNANIAAELSNKFFSRPLSGMADDAMTGASPELSTMSQSSSMPSALPAVSVDRPSKPAGFSSPSKMANFNALPDPGPMLAQPEGLFPRGSFIDRIA